MLKTSLTVALLLATTLSARPDTLSSLRGRYLIAPSSRIVFSVAQVGGGGIAGTFSHFSGTFDLHPDDIARSSVTLSLQPASVKTSEPRIGNFLRSSAVFDAVDYPVITFHSTSVRREGDNRAVVEGSLTARGVSHGETFKATLTGRQGRTVSFHVVGDILRSPYGMDVGTPIYSNVAHFDMMLKGERK
ncbi:MAG: polyisoprenoid-binding protein [Rhizobiaceae bacterium]|nr:MAG: polyisoprenoid-binding protein [Rhizobiaceae bacterium]